MAKKKKRSTRRTGTRPVTPEDLARLQIVSDPQIDPAGERIVFVHKDLGAKNAGVSRLFIVDSDGQSAPQPFTSGDKDRHPRWSPDGGVIAFIRTAEKGRPQVCLIDADGGEARALTSFPEGSIREIRWSPDGTQLGVVFRLRSEERTEAARKKREADEVSDPPWVLDDWWYRLDGDGYFGADRYRLYLVDAETGEDEEIYAKDRLGFFDFDFSPDGKSIALAVNEDKDALVKPWKDKLLVYDIARGKTRSVPNLPAGPKSTVRWSPDGKSLAYAGREGKDGVYSVENLELYVCDAKKGGGKSLTGREDYCLMAVALSDCADVDFAPGFAWQPDSKRLDLRIGHHGETHLASVAANGKGSIAFHTKGVYSYEPGNRSRNGRRRALVRSSPDRLPEIYVGNEKGRTLSVKALSSFNDAFLAERDLGQLSRHQVKTADGTTVETWVLLPPGHTKDSRKKYPGVLEIHGGPHAQYGIGFFHEFQMLAGAGYAVVFSNPRGSKGYGRDHCASIRGAWGTTDWVDIQAVTAFMQKHPNINAKRMGVMGGSYGGYMTNWVIGHTDDFVGAITDRCVSNLVTMGGTSDFVTEPDRYFPGNFWDRPEARWAQSPIQFIGNATTPTLIIHSEGDLRCNIEQAEQVFMALKLLKVPTRFVRYPHSTSHGFSRGGPLDLRQHRLHQILDWWRKYLH